MDVHNQKQIKAAIIIPCFNEANRLDLQAIHTFLANSPHVDMLFIDDGSSDTTAELLEDIVTAWPTQARAWSLSQNSGKAEAVRCGFQKAISLDYPLIGFWDADLATPFQAITGFINVMNQHSDIDVVWGSRTRLLGHRIRRDRNRYLLGRINSNLSAMATEIPIYDASCGAKLFRNNACLEAIFCEKFVSRWIFDVEILSRLKRLHRNGVSGESRDASEVIYELPVDQWTEIPGSKIKASTFITAFCELVKLAVLHRIQQAPSVNRETIRLSELTGMTEILPTNHSLKIRLSA